MNLWIRLVRVWLAARLRGRPDPAAISVIRIRVWPHDLDVWGHVNGGRYLTLSDLGRLDLFVRTGLVALTRKNRWVIPIRSATVRYRRPLRLFDRCELHTRVLGWDAKCGYMETEFVRGGESVATVVIQGVVRGRDGNIPPARLLELLGFDGPPPLVPDRIRVWVEAATSAEGTDETPGASQD